MAAPKTPRAPLAYAESNRRPPGQRTRHLRRRFTGWAPALLAACTLGLLAAPAQAGSSDAPLAYRVDLSQPATRWVDVRVDVPALGGRSADFAMPAWAPGSYLIRDFGRHVYEVEAVAGKTALEVERVDKQTWRVAHGGQPFELHYRVYADELSVRTSYVDDRMGLLNGTSIFMYLVGDTQRPAQLRVGDRPAGWKVHTSLETPAPGRYEAPSYDALVDAPLLLGEAQRVTFQVQDTAFEYVLVAPSGTNADIDRLAADAERVVTAFAGIMGGFPFDHYSFLVVLDAAGGGGLEHTESTAMIMRPFIFGDDAGYERAAHLAAHEFFHAWNVKRIHDRVLGPFDYARENYTDLLWFHEGFTETMEARAMLAAGLMTPANWLDQLAKSYGRYANRPGADHTPLSELSRDAWIKAYKGSPAHLNTAISYYHKGDLVGVALDLELRIRSRKRGKRGSVEGLFRRLWSGRSKTGDRPIDADEIIRAASAEAGEDMRPFFDAHVYGTEPIELPRLLAAVGLEVFGLAKGASPPEADPPPAEPATDEAPPPDEATPPPSPWLGVRGGGSRILGIDAGSPAEAAGLAVGDEPVAVDGARIDSVDELLARAEAATAGDRIRVAFFRRGRLDRRIVTLSPDPRRTWVFRLPAPEAIGEASRALLTDWLPAWAPNSSQPPATPK